MAKIKFGMMMTDARGKLGGQVFSKNRSGAYVRTKVTPVNPRTLAQQSNRSLLGSLSGAWSGLTEEQRSAWNGVVEQWQKTNVFGDLMKPTGKNLFTGLNKNKLNFFGGVVMVKPPLKVDFPVITNVTVAIGSVGIEVLVSGDGVIGKRVAVRATGLLSSGTTYVKNLYRGIGSFTVTSEASSILSLYSAIFGNPIVGGKYAFEFYFVDESGQTGVPFSVMSVRGS